MEACYYVMVHSANPRGMQVMNISKEFLLVYVPLLSQLDKNHSTQGSSFHLHQSIIKLSSVMSTVIIGAGIIGTSTAYYLSQTSKNAIHLVEASSQLFASASGYAAGFLARDWFSPYLSGLGELSFDLHKQLAEEHNGHVRWGYSQSTGTSLAETVGKNGADWLMEGVSRSTAAARSPNSSGNRPAWLSPGPDLDLMSDGSTTAQWYIRPIFLPVEPICSAISVTSSQLYLLHTIIKPCSTY